MTDYKIGEGNLLGSLPAEFGSDLSLNQKKLIVSASIKKGQVVEISGNMTVAPTTAASKKVIGVAAFDAEFSADKSTPAVVECEGLFKLTASGSITAGSQLESAADGKVAVAGGTVVKVIGIALNDASDASDVYVKFSI